MYHIKYREQKDFDNGYRIYKGYNQIYVIFSRKVESLRTLSRLNTVEGYKKIVPLKQKNSLLALGQLMRPWQWIKNLFVFLGFLFSQDWGNAYLLWHVVELAVAFSLTSSSVYILNDLFDRHKDRLHPKKKNRPLAAGLVSPWVASVMMILLCFIGLTIGYFVSLSALLLLILYFIQNVAYSKYLKNVVILDVFLLASGFMLRILAGTLGVGIEPSHWLLLCGLMLTLFIGFGKRRAELKELADRASSHRSVLENYSESLLEQMMGITAGGVIITYSLYTVDFSTVRLHGTDALIYTVPLVIYGVFRFLYIIRESSEGCDPSKLIIKDLHLVIVSLFWLLSVICILDIGPSLL